MTSGWKPLGRYVLVALERASSDLVIVNEEAKYKTTGEVIGVGDEVVGIHVGDVVLVNGASGVISSAVLGEGNVLVAAPLLLAVKTVEES